MSDSKRKFFKKSTLLWITPAAVLLALGCLWYVGWSSMNSQLSALRAKGLPTSATELNEYYAIPEGALDSTDLWVAAIDTVQDADLDQRGTTLPFLGEGPVPVPGEEWAELETSQTLLAELKDELEAIHKAADAGGQVRFPIDCSAGFQTLLPHTQNSRTVTRLLQFDAQVSAHDGNDSRALRDLRAIFALSNALRGEPILISQLVRMAIHAIGCDAVERLMPHCNWNDAELELLQIAIRSARFKDEMGQALCGERATCLSELDQFSLGPFRALNKQQALGFFAGSIDGLSSSWPEALSRQRELNAEMESLRRESRLIPLMLRATLLLLPATEHAAVAGAQADARQKCTNAAIAAQRYRLQSGRLPDSLTDIGPRLLGPAAEPSARLVDPFDGQPLRYKIEETRVLIYSVGRNAQDDGGDCDRDAQRQPPDVGFSISRGSQLDTGR